MDAIAFVVWLEINYFLTTMTKLFLLLFKRPMLDQPNTILCPK